MNYSTHALKLMVLGEKWDNFYPFIPIYVDLVLFQFQVCLIWQKGDPLWTYCLN